MRTKNTHRITPGHCQVPDRDQTHRDHIPLTFRSLDVGDKDLYNLLFSLFLVLLSYVPRTSER